MENLKKSIKDSIEAEYNDNRIPASVRYWRKKSRNQMYSVSERLNFLENAYNHLLNAYLEKLENEGIS